MNAPVNWIKAKITLIKISNPPALLDTIVFASNYLSFSLLCTSREKKKKLLSQQYAHNTHASLAQEISLRQEDTKRQCVVCVMITHLSYYEHNSDQLICVRKIILNVKILVLDLGGQSSNGNFLLVMMSTTSEYKRGILNCFTLVLVCTGRDSPTYG